MPALGLEESHYALARGRWHFIILDGFELRYPFPGDETLKRESESLYGRLRALGKENAQRWNGGLGSAQISWLERELEAAEKSRKNVLVLSHFPVFPEAAQNLWNDAEVVDVLERHACVKAFFAGHHHLGAYALRNGIHYLTFRAMVETPAQNSFAVVTLEKNSIRVKGFGRESSRALPIFVRETSPLKR
jgi:3',5'-cyclic AMP phosphodiesterase CpdA